MFTIDVSIELMDALLADIKAKGGDAIRFTIYDSTDEVPPSFTTTGLLRPSTELDAGGCSIFPNDRF